MKIVHVLEDSNDLLKGVAKTIKNERKWQKGGSLGMLWGALLGASLLGNMVAVKGVVRVRHGNKQVKGIVWAGYGSKNFSFCLIVWLILK